MAYSGYATGGFLRAVIGDAGAVSTLVILGVSATRESRQHQMQRKVETVKCRALAAIDEQQGSI